MRGCTTQRTSNGIQDHFLAGQLCLSLLTVFTIIIFIGIKPKAGSRKNVCSYVSNYSQTKTILDYLISGTLMHYFPLVATASLTQDKYATIL